LVALPLSATAALWLRRRPRRCLNAVRGDGGAVPGLWASSQPALVSSVGGWLGRPTSGGPARVPGRPTRALSVPSRGLRSSGSTPAGHRFRVSTPRAAPGATDHRRRPRRVAAAILCGCLPSLFDRTPMCGCRAALCGHYASGLVGLCYVEIRSDVETQRKQNRLADELRSGIKAPANPSPTVAVGSVFCVCRLMARQGDAPTVETRRAGCARSRGASTPRSLTCVGRTGLSTAARGARRARRMRLPSADPATAFVARGRVPHHARRRCGRPRPLGLRIGYALTAAPSPSPRMVSDGGALG
jgi:hypothetical protein